jgi:hypothetical protein
MSFLEGVGMRIKVVVGNLSELVLLLSAAIPV